MSGKFSRDKGLRGEREFISHIEGALRIPLSGASEGFKHDVVIPWGANTLLGEIKRRGRASVSFREAYEWLGKDAPDFLAYRADRKEWIVMMHMPAFLKLLQGGYIGDRSGKGNVCQEGGADSLLLPFDSGGNGE